MPILETEEDRKRQRIVAQRIEAKSTLGTVLVDTEQFDSIDYIGLVDNQMRFLFEIKCRKESAEKIQQYPEGLVVRPRTLQHCRDMAKEFNVRAFIVFAFENGLGELWMTEPARYGELPLHPQKPRRNYRGPLSCDLEPMNYLSWTEHLWCIDKGSVRDSLAA